MSLPPSTQYKVTRYCQQRAAEAIEAVPMKVGDEATPLRPLAEIGTLLAKGPLGPKASVVND